MVENGVLGRAFRTGRRAPALIPAINRLLARLMAATEHLDASHRVYANERHVRFTEMEYAIPRERAAEALERVLALIERRRLPVAFPIELRVVAPDDAYLSTAHGRPTAYIAVHQYRGMEFETYFRAVERIMDDYGGRPHWGKRHYQSAHTLAPRYPGWERFQAVRRRFDPEGRFANDYIDRVLGRGLELGAALAAVGRHLVHHAAAAHQVERGRSARRARPPWRAGGRRGPRSAARRRREPSTGRLHLAGALARVQAQPGAAGAARAGGRAPAGPDAW